MHSAASRTLRATVARCSRSIGARYEGPISTFGALIVLSGALAVAWWRDSGSVAVRVEQSILLLTGMIFAAELYVWNLLGWRV